MVDWCAAGTPIFIKNSGYGTAAPAQAGASRRSTRMWGDFAERLAASRRRVGRGSAGLVTLAAAPLRKQPQPRWDPHCPIRHPRQLSGWSKYRSTALIPKSTPSRPLPFHLLREACGAGRLINNLPSPSKARYNDPDGRPFERLGGRGRLWVAMGVRG